LPNRSKDTPIPASQPRDWGERIKASDVLEFLFRLVGREAVFVRYYRLAYWWERRLGRSVAFNYGYAPLSPGAAHDPANAQPYQMEMYHQAALLLGPDRLRGKRVLEISCGLGGGLDHLRRQHGIERAVGLDRTLIALTEARRRFGLAVVNGDARRLPFAGRSFDTIVNIEASHLYFGDDFLKELARVLAPGGSVVLADMRWGGLAEWEATMRSAFAKAGLDVTQFRDASGNVIAACQADTPRREALLATVPWPFRGLARAWAGTETSEDYLSLKDGRAIYFILTARLARAG